ncbi:hypothetical protein MXB_4106 [Myxobolus squamalis]|nr:hypothetical protein MXB_4106 [Myxobolus squamalis]
MSRFKHIICRHIWSLNLKSSKVLKNIIIANNKFLNKYCFAKNFRFADGNPCVVKNNEQKDVEAFKTIKKVLPFLWPKNRWDIKRKVLISLFLLILAKGVYFGPSFAFTTLGCVSTYAFFTYMVTRWRTKYRVIMNQADNECGSRAVDSFINYETVKYFNNEEFESKEYDKILKIYEDAAQKTVFSLSALNFGQSAIVTFGLGAIMLLAANGVIVDTLTLGDLVMVNGLLFQLSIPLNFLGSTYRDIRQSLVDLQSLFDLLQTEIKINNSVDSKRLSWPTKIKIGDPLIRFENVNFSYQDRIVLKNLSFTIPYGKKIAMVGGSGSGKSTIVRLLYRFIDPDEGSIYIFDQNIKNLTLDSVRKQISVVPQDQVLFHNTIMYNIKYGNICSSDEDVYRVSKISGLHDSILRFPNGYSTQVGERGLKLSGGEKQRVAIARAILKNAPIFIYDEATSSLDSITEKKIMCILSHLFHDRTSLVIAHRLSTIVDADEILTLHHGKVAEKGKHIDLLINNPLGTYAQLWNKQHELFEPLKREEKILDLDEILNQNGCHKEGCCSK